MRALMTIGLVVSAAASAAVGQGQATSAARAGVPSHRSNPMVLLNERVEAVALEEVPLDQALEWLADFTSVNVVVRWQVLEDLGV
jgi:hypothetical protein